MLIYKLPPVIYALAIMSLSLWSKTSPPIDLGVEWEDKIYHFFEYLCFGILIFRAFPRVWQAQRRQLLLFGMSVFGLVYAAIDEIVQYFVPGRDSAIGDWAADAAGYLLAALLMITWYGRRRARANKL
ncbi:MAG: VanZ family protein [bacterium]